MFYFFFWVHRVPFGFLRNALGSIKCILTRITHSSPRATMKSSLRANHNKTAGPPIVKPAKRFLIFNLSRSPFDQQQFPFELRCFISIHVVTLQINILTFFTLRPTTIVPKAWDEYINEIWSRKQPRELEIGLLVVRLFHGEREWSSKLISSHRLIHVNI